jgi:hypothetical protein
MGYRGAENWTAGNIWDIQKEYNTTISSATCGEKNKTFGECIYETTNNFNGNHNDVFLTCFPNKGKL